jgi:hypothetical protein
MLGEGSSALVLCCLVLQLECFRLFVRVWLCAWSCAWLALPVPMVLVLELASWVHLVVTVRSFELMSFVFVWDFSFSPVGSSGYCNTCACSRT